MDITSCLFNKGLSEVSYRDFYRDIFPVGSFEKKGVYENGKYNGIIVEVTKEKKSDGKPRILRHTLTDDLDKLDEVAGRNNFCLMSPISYIGKQRKSANARFIYAIAIDLDGIVSRKNLEVLFRQIRNVDYFVENNVYFGLPEPSYFVSSGTGLHLYYVFKKPIPLFQNIVEQLEKLKRRLTWQAWTQGASMLHDNIQYESLFQGFRIVGTVTKNGNITRAFKFGNVKKYTIEELNETVPDDYKAKDIVYKSNLTLKEAKEMYPDWYQTRIVDKKKKGTWVCHRGLYDWWIRKIYEGATQGHRYWCIMTLAAYAKKCGVSYDELVKDSVQLIDFLNEKGDEFTLDDVMKALEAYNDDYITYPIDTIVARTDIHIEKNKRNGRSQEKHLQGARAIRDINNPNWREGNGRKPKKDIVIEWRKNNPNGKKIDCSRETGLHINTVYKWWN